MIAVDTNILVYAHREDSRFHIAADRELTGLAEGGQMWAIPWPCIHEFIAIVTHPRIYNPSTPLQDVLIQVEYWLESPKLELIGEPPNYWPLFKELLLKGSVSGPQVHDARIAAICLSHGVKMLWSCDRDFTRIRGLEVHNPLI